MTDEPIPRWLIACLWLTTPLNLLGAFGFSPLADMSQLLPGLPTEIHPLYRWTIAEFIGLFGLGYGWCAYTKRAPRMFIALGAAGKLAFFGTLASYWALGQLPFGTLALSSADLWLGLAFLAWVIRRPA